MGRIERLPDIRDELYRADRQRLRKKAFDRIDDIRDTAYDTYNTSYIAKINKMSNYTEDNTDYWVLEISKKDLVQSMDERKSPTDYSSEYIYIPKDFFTPKKDQLIYAQSYIDTPDGNYDRFLITENNKLVYAQLENDEKTYIPDTIADNIEFVPCSKAQYNLNIASSPSKIYDAVIAGADINYVKSDGSTTLFNIITNPECLTAAIHCGADINLPHRYWKNPDGTPLTIEDVMNSTPEKFKDSLEVLAKAKAGKLHKIPGKIDKDNNMLQFLARRSNGITARIEHNTERAEIIKVKTNVIDPETNKKNSEKRKFNEAIIMRDENGKLIKSSYIPTKVCFRDKRNDR